MSGRPYPWTGKIKRTTWPELRHSVTLTRLDMRFDSVGRYEARCKCGWLSEVGTQPTVSQSFYAHLDRMGGKWSRVREKGAAQ